MAYPILPGMEILPDRPDSGDEGGALPAVRRPKVVANAAAIVPAGGQGAWSPGPKNKFQAPGGLTNFRAAGPIGLKAGPQEAGLFMDSGRAGSVTALIFTANDVLFSMSRSVTICTSSSPCDRYPVLR